MRNDADQNSIVTWDHREQPDWEQIALAQKCGLVYVTPVEETGDDSFALVVSKTQITPERAQKIFDDMVAEYGS